MNPFARTRASLLRQAVLLFLVGGATLRPSPLGAQASGKEADEEIRRSLETITTVYHLAATHLADAVEPDKAIYEGAIPGALASLDPFSVFLDAAQFQALQDQQRGVERGFGAVLSVQAGKATVLQCIPGSPFARAGLGPGDRILRINGYRVTSLGLQELVEVLQQARSGRVQLAVIRSGQVVPEDFELDPTEVPSSTVDKKFLLEPGIGYLHVARIEQRTPGEIRAALEQWAGQKVRGLLLDLRDNPGGALEAAVATAGLFLPKGEVVVTLKGRAVPETVYRVESEPYSRRLPIVVLLNRGTASAAEIIAAALQEHDRAWLVGKSSFGKGVAESVLPLSEGAALALTTARYFTPQGRSVQRPLPETALAGILEEAKPYATDQGRPLGPGGSVEPDQVAERWPVAPWAGLLEQSTAFINFAESYLEREGKVGEDFEVDDRILEEFQRFLEESGVQVPASSWQQQRDFLKVRIKAELFNLVFGMSRGDEVEVKADPQVQAAVGAFHRAEELLAPRQAARALPAGGNP